MRTVTFYSYKGGTGRTLLLANVAVLAARMGWKVVAVDVDLEAPGLTYKLFEEPAARCDGLVGWLRDRFETGKPPLSLGDSLLDFELTDPFEDGGWLKVIPAGRHPSLNYFQDLVGLHLEQRIHEGPGVDAFVDLQQQVREQLDPDLLLLDARTGISSTNLVTTRVLADDVIALTLDSREQLDGTRSVLRSLTPLTSLRTEENLRLNVVLSRVAARPADIGSYTPTVDEREQIARVRTFLRAPADPLRATLTVERIHLLHTEPSLVRREFLTLARTRVLDATALHVDCVRIAEAVLGEEVRDIAAQVISQSADPARRELLARFFARPEDIMDASGEVIARRLAAGDKSVVRDKPPRRTQPRGGAGRSRNAGATYDSAARGQALNNLAAHYVAAGRHEAARVAAELAVGVYERLVASDPEFVSSLAAALMKLGISNRQLGKQAEALAPAMQSAEIYEGLAQSEPRFQGDLAAALDNLAELRSATGDHERGLRDRGRAVELHRSIAETQPAVGTPLLASSLRELANQLEAAGEGSAARAAAAESERLYAALLDDT